MIGVVLLSQSLPKTTMGFLGVLPTLGDRIGTLPRLSANP